MHILTTYTHTLWQDGAGRRIDVDVGLLNTQDGEFLTRSQQ